jgi:hypothetical protein
MGGWDELKSPLVIVLLFIFAVAIGVAIYIFFLYQNYFGETITLIFSGIVATATVFYVILTRQLVFETKKTRQETAEYVKLTDQLVDETRKMREIQTDPKIFVEVTPRGIMLDTVLTTDLDLVVRNIGFGPAYDITFKKLEESSNLGVNSTDNKSGATYSLRSSLSAVLEKQINYLAPSSEVSWLFWPVISNYENEMTGYVVKISVEYYKYPKDIRENASKPFSETYTVDFTHVMGQFNRAGSNVVTALQGIKAELHKLSKSQ